MQLYKLRVNLDNYKNGEDPRMTDQQKKKVLFLALLAAHDGKMLAEDARQ
jgi:hypothetical protein